MSFLLLLFNNGFEFLNAHVPRTAHNHPDFFTNPAPMLVATNAGLVFKSVVMTIDSLVT
jgi:hypothetical protein